jgi:hypothetical protein
MTTVADQASLQTAIATELYGALRTAADWSSAEMFWSSVDDSSQMSLEVINDQGAVSYPDVPWSLDDKFRELKAGMADPEKGGWLSVVIKLAREGRYTFGYNYDRRVYWNPDAPTPLDPPAHGDLDPDDAAYVAEFERFPRSAEYLPEWAPSRPPADHDQDRIDAILAVPAPVPAQLQPLADQWGWPDLLQGAEEAFGRRLHSEPYRSMLDEVSRRDGDRVADGLIQDVIADLMASHLDPRPARDVIRVWRGLAAVRGLPEPDGLDQLDPDSPLDRASEVAVQLRGDISSALDAVVDAKIAARFP